MKRPIRVNKFHLIKCVLIFLLSWCFVLFIIYYFFHRELMNGNNYTLRAIPISVNSIQSFSNSFLSHSIIADIANSHTPKPSLIDSIDKEIMHIYLDYPLDDRLFTVDNYKALESLLHIYPTSKFRCQIYTSRDAYFYKIGNALSINQFIKYKKLQYDISVVPYNIKLKSRTTLYGRKIPYYSYLLYVLYIVAIYILCIYTHINAIYIL